MKWPTAPFSEVIRDVTGGNIKLQTSQYGLEGQLAIVDQGKALIAAYTDDMSCRVKSSGPHVVFGDHTGAIKFIDFPFAIGADGTKVLQPKGSLDAKFLFHYLHTVRLPNSGYDRKYKYLKRVLIPLPPLEEQRRIAAILDQAEALRAQRRAAIALLDQLPQAIFLEMFGDPATNPMGWPEVKLCEICRPKQWPTISQNQLYTSGYPVYGANGVIGYYYRFTHTMKTVLITCRGATCGNIHICEPPAYVTGNAMALDDLSDLVNYIYLSSFLHIAGVKRAITGTAQPQITRASLEAIKILLPPLALQERYASHIEAINCSKITHQLTLHELDDLLSSIQSSAFKGHV